MPRPNFKDYETFTEEVAKAVEEGRVVKVGNVWRVYQPPKQTKKAESKKVEKEQ